jgi:hypothetical protein
VNDHDLTIMNSVHEISAKNAYKYEYQTNNIGSDCVSSCPDELFGFRWHGIVHFSFVCFYYTGHDVCLFYFCSVMGVHWLVWWSVYKEKPPCPHLVPCCFYAIFIWNQYSEGLVPMYGNLFLTHRTASSSRNQLRQINVWKLHYLCDIYSYEFLILSLVSWQRDSN